MLNIDSIVLKTLNNYVEKHGLGQVKFQIADGHKGDGFIGIISKICIKQNESNKKDVNVILKRAREGDTRAAFSIADLFYKEIIAYEKILPTYKELQMSKMKNTFVHFAKLVGTNIEDGQEWLMMEDITQAGYIQHRPRQACFDALHTEAALKGLAQFHALSFILERRQPKLHAEFRNLCNEVMFDVEQPRGSFKKFISDSSLAALELIPKDKPYYHRLKRLCENNYDTLAETVKPRKYSVLCHGDYWKNNMMFKHEGDVITSVCPLDYQLMRYSSPATDILYLLFNCTDKKLRSEHFHYFLAYYYKELGLYLRSFDMTVAEVFPWEEFMSEIRRVGIFGLGQAMFILPFLTCPDDAVLDLDDLLVSDEETEVPINNLFKERLLEVVDDSVSYGFI